MDLLRIAAPSIFAASGMFIRGLTGFGSALIMTPLLLLIFELKTAVVATAIIEIAAGLVVTIQARKDFHWHYLKVVLPLSLAGIGVGAFILVSFDSQVLKRVFGGFTAVFALRILLNLKKPPGSREKWPWYTGYISGALGGVLGGLFGTAGPPIAVYLENQIEKKDALRATMLAYFLSIDSVRLIPYGYSGLITPDVVKICLVMLPASFFGAFMGRVVHVRINEKAFRAVIGILLLAMGMYLAAGK